MFTNGGVSKAQAEVKKFLAARLDFEDREEKARDELASLERLLPGMALELMLHPGDQPVDQIQQRRHVRIGELKTELENLVITRPQLLKRLEDALRSANVAKAGELRKLAAKVEKEFQAHRSESERLLGLIQAHEGVRFIPDRVALSYQPYTLGGQKATSAGESSAPLNTKSDEFAWQIQKLLTEAAAIENRLVNAGGVAQAENLEGLLAAVAAVEDIAPTERAVRSWYAEAVISGENEYQRELLNFPGDTFERVEAVTLQWGPNAVLMDGSRVAFSRKVVWKKVPAIMSSSFR